MTREHEDSEGEILSDADWAAIRDAVPTFSATWRQITQDSYYDGTLPFVSIHELAKHIVEKVIRERPGEVERLADTLECDSRSRRCTIGTTTRDYFASDQWKYRLLRPHEAFWQLADGSSWPARDAPNEEV